MQTPDSQILWGSFFNAQSLKYDLHIMIWLAQWWMNVSWLSAQKLVTCKAPDPSGQMCRRLHAISPVPCFRDTRFRFAVDLYYLGTIPWNFPVNLEHCLDIALNIFVWHVSLHERSPDIYVLAGIYPHVDDWRIERAGKAFNRCSIDRSSGILAIRLCFLGWFGSCCLSVKTDHWNLSCHTSSFSTSTEISRTKKTKTIWEWHQYRE